MLEHVAKIAEELSIQSRQVNGAVELLFEQECTIPFVARYRKEVTGSLDEVQLRTIRDRYQYLTELETNRSRYMKAVEQVCQAKPEHAGKWPELQKRFLAASTKQELEDLYLPFKPKRRTRAAMAREKGLQPLLDAVLEQRQQLEDLLGLAAQYVTKEGAQLAPTLQVKTPEEALAGAADILAEQIAEDADIRARARQLSQETGHLTAQRVAEEPAEAATPAPAKKGTGGKGGKSKNNASKYENYFDYREPLSQTVSHRILAVRRGEAEKILRVGIEVDEPAILHQLTSDALGEQVATDSVKAWITGVVEDAYRRLLAPSIETELRLQLKSTAEQEAIKVFSENIQNLLLLPPIPGEVVLGVDPGLRTGSKLAVVDNTGKLLAHSTVYPDPGGKDNAKTAAARAEIGKLLTEHKVAYVAIGNGTGSREIGKVVAEVLRADPELKKVRRVVVNESGASVYSTDDIAREEFPDLDPTIRSAVSIARRLQDPLAELVKIDPKSIGVGQYQHDINPAKLGRSLGDVVESCVNKVGVNLNTASHKLLSYVSGIGPSLAKAILRERETNGPFETRDGLNKVKGFGPKAFQQAAGFLRISGGVNPLDNSSVHPEAYGVVEQMAAAEGKPLGEIIGNSQLVEAIPLDRFVTENVGLPTLQDIVQELIKPGRDPREDGIRLVYSEDVCTLEDLKPGMKLPGTVTNVTNFGAFVDIGVHQDGLVHISELCDDFVDDPSKVVSVGQVVKITVIDVDLKRRRISLSMRSGSRDAQTQQRSEGGQRGSARGGQRPGQGRGKSAPHGSMSTASKRGPLKQRNGRGGSKKAQDQKNFTLEDLMSKFNANH